MAKAHFFPRDCDHEWVDSGEVVMGQPIKKGNPTEPFPTRKFFCAHCPSLGFGIWHTNRWEITEEAT